MKPIKVLKNKKGMTLVEVLVAATIFAFCLSGLLLTYMNLFILTDLSRDSTIANSALSAKLEELKSSNFDDLPAYNNTTFNVVDLNNLVGGAPMVIGHGRVCVYDVLNPYTNESYPDLARARVLISFTSRNRTIGNSSTCGENAGGISQLRTPVEAVITIKSFTNSTLAN